MTAPVSIDVVVCTYENVASLEVVLEALAGQDVPAGVDWGVLVVDNNCTDGTPALLKRLEAEGRLPLTTVRETEQGLTPARQRGVHETRRDWIAFVDDDCVVDPDWIAQAAAVARERPEAGGFGGVVELEWEREPPGYVQRHTWAYAHQDHGGEPRRVPALAGAGMVLRRSALEATGWTERPLLADRVGRRLVSGGDVEITLRVAARYELWFDPRLKLRHTIAAQRTTARHLAKLTYGLGTSKLFGDSMVWEGSYRSWAARSIRETAPFARTALASVRHGHPVDAFVDARFVQGWLAGIWRLRRADPGWRAALLGSASPVRPA
jgi:glycosyltransferase involved in cell wall biosynthesis